MPDRLTTVYRLVKERFIETPLSTEGARRWGGRWNPQGVGILYASATPELALLEQLVHLPTLPYDDLPQLFLLTLTLPDEPRVIPPDTLPPNWRDEVSFSDNHHLLAQWLSTPDVLAVGVPSAVVAESLNYLLHPLHPSFGQIQIIRAKPFLIDSRLWRPSS